jgi:hypothetical protein
VPERGSLEGWLEGVPGLEAMPWRGDWEGCLRGGVTGTGCKNGCAEGVPGKNAHEWRLERVPVRNFPCQTLKISKVSLVVIGS